MNVKGREEIRVCTDCEHFGKASSWDVSQCSHPRFGINLVNGEAITKYAERERAGGDCGREGRYFELKKPLTTKQRTHRFVWYALAALIGVGIYWLLK